MAAVLALGAKAAISHASAGELWSLLPSTSDSPVDLTCPRDTRGPTGVRVHVGDLDSDETTRLDGVPVTTPARTLVDLASRLGRRDLERALARAKRESLADSDAMAAVLLRYAGRRGVRLLRELTAATPSLTRSKAEEEFLALIRRARLPGPLANARVRGVEVDFLWRAERLIVEVDGFAYHGSRGAFHRDRRRDGAFLAAGFRVMRFTWRDLRQEPEAVVARVAQALTRRT